MKKTLILLALLISFSSIYSQTYTADAIDGRVIFKLKDNVKVDGMNAVRPADLNTTSKIDKLSNYPAIDNALSTYSIIKLDRPSYYTNKAKLIRIFVIDFSNYSEIDNVIRELESLDIVEYAEKQFIRQTTFIPNDTYWDGYNNWYLTQVNASQAWDISQGNTSIKVAIVDNAVFCGHNDLATYRQRDVADNDDDATPPEDYNTNSSWSHGTHCAGLATAEINNNIGITSLGAGVELIGIKATPDDGEAGSVYYGYQGLQWAADNGANVISMSWGGSGNSQSSQDLINSYPNIVFLAAAGNDGVSTQKYPGAYDNVICVGSVNSDDSRSSFSNYNAGTDWVDIASPGGYSNGGLLSSVYTTGSGYARMGGTSMATPFAAGLAGLMLSLNPSLSPAEVEACMISSGETIGQNIGPRINAYAAMQCVQSTLTGDPNANFFVSSTSVTVGNSATFTDLSSDGGNAITNWQWTFTGGTPSTFIGETPPVITYSSIGTYTVELTVTNSQSNDTETKSDYITVSEEAYGAWIEQASGFSTASRGITNFSIVDENTVWGLAFDGTGDDNSVQEFTRTIDGGNTWVPGTIDVGNATLGIAMIHARSATKAYVVAFKQSGGTQGIYVTTDGGSSWSRQTSADYQSTGSFSNVVYFWDDNNGFCMGDPINNEYEIYTTTNGGTTWNLVPGANIPAPTTGEYGYTGQYSASGDHVWFTTNKGRMYHSSDKGYNWTVSQTPISDFGGEDASGNFDFKDASNGIIVDNSANVYTTTDGGSNWSTVTPVGTVYKSDVCWIEGTDVIFSTGVNPAGSSYSNDGGTTWTPIDTEIHASVEFTSQTVGWSGNFNEDATNKGIWKWGSVSALIPDFSAAPSTLCPGTTVSFSDNTTGATVTSWSWDFPGGTPSSSTSQNPSVIYNTPGNYDVTLTVDDGNGAVNKNIENYITVNLPAPTASFTYVDTDGTVAFTNTSTGTATYSWDFGDGNSSTDTDPVHTYATSNNYSVSLTAANSCGTDVSIQDINVVVGIYDIDNNSIKIYPNPVKNRLNIELSNNANTKYQIFDISGKLMTEGVIEKGTNSEIIYLNNYDSGIYTLRLNIDNSIINHKIIVE